MAKKHDYPKTYEACLAFLNLKAVDVNVWNGRKVPGIRSTMIFSRQDACIVRYHDTNVVTFYQDGRIILNSEGFRTVTTKRRMNQFSPAEVYQRNSTWYAVVQGEKRLYKDGMYVHSAPSPHDYCQQKTLNF